MDAPANGCGLDPEYAARLRGIESEPLDEHERLALARRKPREDTAELGTRLDLGWRIGLRGRDGTMPQRAGEMPQAVPMHVERCSIHVAHGCLHHPDPLPMLERAGERLLCQVLGLRLTSGHDHERTNDRPVMRPEEGLEGVPPRRIEHHQPP